MRKNLVHNFIVITSLLSIVIFLTGFIFAIQNVLSSDSSTLPTLPNEVAKPTDTWNAIGLGDSLTRGIGDSEGNGYISLLLQALKANDTKSQLTNLAVSGATSTDLAQQLTTNGVLRSISQANLIVITIGGNDLFRSAGLQEIDLKNVTVTEQLYLDNLNQIITSIRAVNESAPIYLLGLYNPFGDLQFAELTTKVVVDWNYQAELLTLEYTNVNFVPIADIFQGSLEDVLYSDHFHPNKEGYRRISNRLIQLILPHNNL